MTTPPSLSSRVGTLSLVLLLLCSSTALGIISDVKITGKSDHELLGSFGYRVGGTAQIELRDGLEAQKSVIECYICSTAQYAKVVTSTLLDRHVLKTYCNSFKPNATHRVYDSDLYRVYLAYKSSVSGTARVTLLNPGGEHLSVGYIQLPSIYFFATILWGFLSFAYASYLLVLHFLRYGHYPITAIHLLLLACAAVRFAYALLTAVAWAVTSASGLGPGWAPYAEGVLCALFETLFFTVMIALARGWCVMVAPRVEPQAACGLGALFLTVMLSSIGVSDIAYIVVLIVYFFLVTRILAYCMRNMKLLLAFKALVEHGAVDAATPAAEGAVAATAAKTTLFGLLRIVALFAFVAFLLEKSAFSMVSYKMVWMSAAFFEMYFVLLAAVMGYMTSPKKFALVFRSVEAADFVGAAARMAAHPYEMNLDPLPSVFVRDDVEKLIKRKRVAVIRVDPFVEDGAKNEGRPGYVLAVKKHLLCPRKKNEHGKENDNEKDKKTRKERKERKERERKKRREKRREKRKRTRMERNGSGGSVDSNSFVINVMNDDVELIEERRRVDDAGYKEEDDGDNDDEKKEERKKSKKVKTKKGFQQLSGSPSSSDVEEGGYFIVDDDDDDESVN